MGNGDGTRERTGRPGAGRAAYLLAALVGVAWVWRTFPAWALLGHLPAGAPANLDLIQHVMGQRYFWHQPWGRPWHLRHLLLARSLDVPDGVMIGLTDSLPLVTLLLKPFVPLLAGDFQAITPWLALAWVLQPVAAVFALRSAGERRPVPALAVACCASAMPSFLMRLSHAALSTHFVLLLALGLSLRLAAPAGAAGSDGGPRRGVLLGACVLVPLLLLVHPYLMAMAVILLLAAPLTLCVRGDRAAAVRQAGWLSASIASTAGLAWALGYAGGSGAAGFGLYSMNLFSPFRPDHAALLGTATALDATGGQYEGYQYLGCGLLVGMAVAPSSRRGRAMLRRLPFRHPGLLAACAALTAFALSDRVYAGHALLLSLPEPPGASAFRASGRFFWPVAYALLVGTVAVLAGNRSRIAWPLLGLVALLQTLDARALRDADWSRLRATAPYPFDAVRLQAAMARSDLLDIEPAWPCQSTIPGVRNLMDVLSVADRVLVPVTTMYTARQSHPPRCDAAAALRKPLRPGELLVLLPGRLDLLGLVPDGGRFCRRSGILAVCGRDVAALF